MLFKSKEFEVNHVWPLTNYTIKYDRIPIVYGKSAEKTDITRGRLCSLFTLDWLSLILVDCYRIEDYMPATRNMERQKNQRQAV